jgi:hypothetical protein
MPRMTAHAEIGHSEQKSYRQFTESGATVQILWIKPTNESGVQSLTKLASGAFEKVFAPSRAEFPSRAPAISLSVVTELLSKTSY